MIVHDRISSFVAGSIQRSQSPAKARIGAPSAAVNRCGCLPPASSVHSKNPLAGMMQRRRLKESRNIGLSAIVSARALNVVGTSFRLFFQKYGTRPQRIETSSRRPSRSRRITSTFVVGATFVVRAQIARRAEHLEECIDLFPCV